MKFAFMSFSTPTLRLGEILGMAEQYGYDGIEPRLDANHCHGVEVNRDKAERELIRETVRRSGVALACLATSCRFADPDTSEQNMSEAHDRIDLAGDVGAPCLRVFGGDFPSDLTREAAIDQLVAALSSLADHAQDRNVTLCLETHDAWCDPQHIAAVMERVARESVAVNWDIMHPVRTRLATMEQAFSVLHPWIRHVHVHDGTFPDGELRLVPIGKGEIDHKRAMDLLSTCASFNGFVSGEWINYLPAEDHLAQELMMLRQFTADQ